MHCIRAVFAMNSSSAGTHTASTLGRAAAKDYVATSLLQVLEGPDGAKSVGWPAFHKSTVMASPLLYDADLDGVRDAVLATYNGEVLFFKDSVSVVSLRGLMATTAMLVA